MHFCISWLNRKEQQRESLDISRLLLSASSAENENDSFGIDMLALVRLTGKDIAELTNNSIYHFSQQ